MDYLNRFKKLTLPLHGVRLPVFPIEAKYKKAIGVDETISNPDFLRALCLDGFKKLNLSKGSEEYKSYSERVKYELEIINELGFVDYILLVWDVINFCKVSGIPVGKGRGSAASSCVLFLIGITKIDPIKYGLFFERFISKTRSKKTIVDGVTYFDGSLLCDVDLDISFFDRHRVIEYLNEKFKGKTCHISTLNTLTGKLLIKECGKIVGGKPEQEMTQVSELIPKIFGVVRDIEEAYEGKKDDDGEYKMEPVKEFKEWCDNNKDVYEIALKLRGLIKNMGVHASGLLINYDNLEDSIPTQLSSDKSLVSAFDMNSVLSISIKLDLLGLRSVSVVDDICKSLGIKEEDIDIHDSFIYDNLQDLKTPHGLFQIEAPTNYKVCQKIKPKNLEDLSAVLAIARPGALQFTDSYANFSNNGVSESLHPFFDDILGKTGNNCLYQESLMQMLNKIGFTLDESETCRKIIGKKLLDKVKEWEAKIKNKVKENNLDPKIGDIAWRILNESASYSFNRSHSFSYSSLCALTVLLKFKYPQQFFLSLLKMSRNEPNPILEISKIQKELIHFNIRLLPPDIIKSQMDFSIEGNDIRFGLLSIKGISDKSIEKLNNFRHEYSNKFEIFEGAEEAGVPIGVLSAILQAGALEVKESRSKVVLEAQSWNLLTQKEKQYAIQLGPEYNYDLFKIIKKLTKLKNDKGKEVMKAPEGTFDDKGNFCEEKLNLAAKRSKFRFVTFYKKYKDYKKIYEINKKSERFANWWYMDRLLGYNPGKSLRDIFFDSDSDLQFIDEISILPKGSIASFIGKVLETYQGTGKNISKDTGEKTKYLRLSVSDETNTYNVLIFNNKLKTCQKINEGFPKEGDIVLVRGKKMEDAVFADTIFVKNACIYTKLSDLKK